MSDYSTEFKQMTDQAFVLHTLPYKETSLIVELFTLSAGRIPVVAKGAKRKHSALRSVIVQFQPLIVKFSGRSELKTLVSAEWQGFELGPEGRAIFAAYYLNELLMLALKREDPHSELFQLYAKTLSHLTEASDVNLIIRKFELKLLELIGYGIDFSQDKNGLPIQESSYYSWQSEAGWVVDDEQTSTKSILGETIHQVNTHGVDSANAKALKPLTRQALAFHAAPNGFTSRIWMEQLVKND